MVRETYLVVHDELSEIENLMRLRRLDRGSEVFYGV